MPRGALMSQLVRAFAAAGGKIAVKVGNQKPGQGKPAVHSSEKIVLEATLSE